MCVLEYLKSMVLIVCSLYLAHNWLISQRFCPSSPAKAMIPKDHGRGGIPSKWLHRQPYNASRDLHTHTQWTGWALTLLDSA